MSYVVVAPLVLAKDQRGFVRYHYEGTVIAWLDNETAEHLLSNGLVESVTDVVPPGVNADPAEADSADGAANRPAQTAPKAVWVEYAVAKGFDPAEAEKLSKPELISLTES